jgi:hypothetical protein
MSRKWRIASAALVGSMLLASSGGAKDLSDSLQKGKPDLKSAGPLAFGPGGILFIGDTQGAALFAVDTGDRDASKPGGKIRVENISQAVADLLGTRPQQVTINDVAVNPASGTAYLSVSRGQGPDASPVILRVGTDGKLQELGLEEVKFAKANLPNPVSTEAEARGQKLRGESITDIAYLDGRVFVAGLSNEEFSSRLLAIPFPFEDLSEGAGIEIYHGAHGRFETKSPVRTFVTLEVKGEPHLLAAYTCTPLVKIPVSELKPGAHVKGTTIAELGNRNRPLDMIVYQKDGKDYLLLANNSRGVMKIQTEGADSTEAITSHVEGTKGLSYETIQGMKGVEQLDKLDSGHALVLIRGDSGSLNLETVDLP